SHADLVGKCEPTTAGTSIAENLATFVAHFARPSQRRLRLALGVLFSRVTRVNGKAGKECEPAAKPTKNLVVQHKFIQQLLKIVSLSHVYVQLFKQRLQVFFSRLLAVKTNHVMQRRLPSDEQVCD